MMDNKLLHRDLQTSISNLKSAQLKKMLIYYEKTVGALTEKTFSKKSQKNHECLITGQNDRAKGFGRSQEQALSNASKNFFSTILTSSHGLQIIRNALKYKDLDASIQNKERTNKKPLMNNETIMLEQISMIGNRQQAEKQQNVCECMFFQLNKQNERKIKHLEARINLLSEQNTMLKKLLLQDYDKENHSSLSNAGF